ncbi:MAG: type II toxin-antitoxin system prevent-host-death family antitoxin [Candidatus Obscuribacterales bacterium]|jgi:prevent-host-death family protein
MKQYSIAHARDNLAAIVHELEGTYSVELTRRGRTVAVIVSKAEYDRLQASRPSFWEACMAFRAETSLADAAIDPSEVFGGLREPSPGREIDL